MQTLSIRQPWAWLVVNGYKTIENRSWYTNHRGPLLIHASGTMDITGRVLENFRRTMAVTGIVIPNELQTAGIVGIVDLTDCIAGPDVTQEIDPDEWYEPGSSFAWIFKNAKTLPFKPAPGKLHLFETNYQF